MQQWSLDSLSWKEKNDKIAELEKQMAMKAGHHEKKALSSFLFVVGGRGRTKFNVGGVRLHSAPDEAERNQHGAKKMRKHI